MAMISRSPLAYTLQKALIKKDSLMDQKNCKVGKDHEKIPKMAFNETLIWPP